MNKYIQEHEEEFENVIDFFKKEIATLRTGRANPAILDGVQVEAYGSRAGLNSMASITVADAQSIVVAPWDKSVSKAIEKAIVEANLGVGVVNEGMQLRITVPRMTEENRKDLVKKLNEKHEESRIKFRKIREEVKSKIEKAEKDKEISEDNRFIFIGDLDKEVHEKNEELKALRDKKEVEVMTI
ncbi:ribosome recycling factor [Candidatus Parcubacteria bacterium]|nr:ribosome recycling factor [Patescibacteria group bacterium]MBU4309142.1 ribosome recycling factor [Patescibacteria group bacterium]MBU4432165.1 ribosome recycling factor [Patescibacteria group bacterium]MBU4577503.1 ribosome recycling factor [Patescibacteria group bacterium]MCG2697190.1 ribosome recycling factor [Candidatus Parcubacteria bacterium]